MAMTSSPTSSSDAERSRAFERLHPRMQRWVHDQGWLNLHDAQEQAIGPILAGSTDVIIAAATAAGKTEAAFLPILSSLASIAESELAIERDSWTAHDPWAEPEAAPASGVQVLCLSPLKALINDQFNRLEQLCERVEVPVHRWHGDVAASAKKRLLDNPSGVLLITPESLEATFVNRGTQIPGLFAGLRYIVIDELHSFIASPRGAQLQSLMNRVDLAIRRRPPRIGLSATLGDMAIASNFLRPTQPEGVEVIELKAVGAIQLPASWIYHCNANPIRRTIRRCRSRGRDRRGPLSSSSWPAQLGFCEHAARCRDVRQPARSAKRGRTDTE